MRAVRQPAGGAFGAPFVVVPAGAPVLSLTAGVSAGGDAIVAWETLEGTYQLPYRVRVHTRIAPAGRPFGHARATARTTFGAAPVLAVAGDGRALLALPARRSLRVAERPPGGAFGSPVTVARTAGAPEPAVTLADGGRAAVAWTEYPSGRAGLVARSGPGGFGSAVTLAGGPRRSEQARALAVLAGSGDSLGLGQETHVATSLTPDGVVAAWLAPRGVGGVGTDGVRAAFVPAAGGPVERSSLGGGLRDAATLTLYPLDDVGAGVAWPEPGSGVPTLLHAAVPGVVPPADPPAPAVRVGRPRRTLLRHDEALRLPVSCSAACDVRAQVHGADGELSLPAAGDGVLHVGPGLTPFARPEGGSVRLRLLSGAPGAAHPQARTLSLHLRLRPLPPRPRVRGLRAMRRPDDRIRMTWTTDVASARTVFVAAGAAIRTGRGLTLDAAVGTRHRRRFAVTLRHVRGVRFVRLITYAPGRPARKPLVIRVR